MDTQIKQYEPLFLEWYWASPFGAVEKAAEQFRKGIRLAEVKRCEEFRARCSRINGDYLQLRNHAIEEQRRQLEEQQRQQAEAERQREVEALKSQQTPEAEQAAERLAQEPLIPVAVSREQAAIAANVPAAPVNVSGRKVYEREIIDWPLFLDGLASNPMWTVSQLFSKQADGSYRLSFAKLKSSAQPLPGVKVTTRYETANRGR